MVRTLLAALLALSATATAQTQPETPSEAAPAPAQPAPAQPAPTASDEEVRREFEQKLEEAKKEIRQEVRAQLATQTAAQGWEEEFVDQTRRLELLELDGYFRVRPELFYKYDLNRLPDPAGYTLFPRGASGSDERTIAGANMRFRVQPTINVSEEVRIVAMLDALDNLVMGSTPTYANTRDTRYQFGIFENGQIQPMSALNALQDSVHLKRAYGEVSTPLGILRFGRMASHWGVGMLYNDGNCIDCDYGDSVDRIMFVTEPFAGWYVAPMIEFNGEGPTSDVLGYRGQPFDLSNIDDTHSLVLAVARRDTDQQRLARLDNDLHVFNYGLHFSYRTQRLAAPGWEDPPLEGVTAPVPPDEVKAFFVPRRASLYIPDVWAKYERKNLRVELEVAAVLGEIESRALSSTDAVGRSQSLQVVQFGGVAQGEYRLMNGQLGLELELGFASGDKAPGFGNYPARQPVGAGAVTGPGGVIEGPQYVCNDTGCPDGSIRNFRFNRAYRTDLILFREILEGITDAAYVRPRVSYRVADGFDIFGQAIASTAIYEESTPSQVSRMLGIELNAGATYETEDGFLAVIQYGILFPQDGLANVAPNNAIDLETAQVIRGILGIRY